MSLTDTAIRAAKPTDKQQKLFDGNGLFLLVAPTGTKSWRLKYGFQGKEKLITLGLYPLVTLKDARARALTARKLLSDGKDPSMERKLGMLRLQTTFEIVAREWHEKQAPGWSVGYQQKTLATLIKNVFPYIGSRPITEISTPELLVIVRRLESRGAISSAHAIRSLCSAVFRYAVATGRALRNPVPDIYGALTAHVKKHYPAITDPAKVGELMLKIDDYHGMPGVRCALQLMALTFCRTTEIRHAEWSEFDFTDKLWRIPAAKMKMSRDHIVPLSEQAIAVVNYMRMFSDHARYVFLNQRNHSRPLGVSSLINALRIMGYAKEEVTPHGFRSMASTLLNEQGYQPDVIERQLAHVPSNQVRAAYNRAEYLPERRKMMTDWANYLDTLRERARKNIQ
jgi:integrase